jgi:2,4-dienoyl-CoA reductase-like NADH-dependent reductase (Old Yellow Enzyme family)
MSAFELMSKPMKIGMLTIRNRIVMPPMVLWIAPPDATVTPPAVAHYERSKGIGLVIVEATAVAPEGRLSADQIGIFEDRHVEGLRRIASAIHGNGSLAAIQIHHAGRNTRTKGSFFGLGLVAPSAVNPDGELPKALTEEGIQRIIGCFASGARRAMEAGFDAVEIHAAHGFLASQFLSPLANHRADRWGGSLENRARFLMEVLAAVKAETKGRIAVWCRLGVVDGGTGGLTLDEGREVARWLKADGMPLLHVSSGIGDLPRVAPQGSPFSDRFHLGAIVKKAVDIPVISVGEIRRPEEAERALREGLTDLVAVGRGILADPQWARKSLEGRQGEIHYCRNCKECQHFVDAARCPARREAMTAAAKGCN